MPERLYQGKFDETLALLSHQEVTPKGFASLDFSVRKDTYNRVSTTEQPQELSRFVREVSENVQISCPQDAAVYLQQKVFAPFHQFDQEELWVLLLNTKNKITHEVMIYRGTINTIQIRPAELFKEAVRVNAGAVILSHCHPSGDPNPSPEDVMMTYSAYQNSMLLGIELLDHIVVGSDSWVSLKEQGMGFAAD